MGSSMLIYDASRTQQSLATAEEPAIEASLAKDNGKSSAIAHLPKLVALLAERKISGPWHLRERNLNALGAYRASGGFFDVFDDATDIMSHAVYRRVGAHVAHQPTECWRN